MSVSVSREDQAAALASLENAPDCYLILSPALEIIGVTDAYLAATMTRRDEIMGRCLFDVFPDNPEDPTADGVGKLRASLDRVLRTRAPDEMAVQKYDMRRPREDGGGFQEKYWKPLNTPVVGQDGRIACIVHRVDDVTALVHEQRDAKAALNQSETNFAILANSIPQMVWMTDETGWIFWYNKRWFDYTGTTLEEMQGWGWQKVHHPDHVDRVTEKFKRALENAADWEDTFPIKGKDGNYRWFLSRARAIRAQDGNVAHWFGTNTDITEQRDAEQALRDSEEFNRRILEESPDCIKVLDLDGRVRFINEGGLVALEIDDSRKILDVDWLDLWVGPHLPAAKAALAVAIAGESGRFQGAAPTAKGLTKWWDVRISPIDGADGKPERLLCISKDATAEHFAEETTRKLNLELEQRVNQRTSQLVEANDALMAEIAQREIAETQLRQMQKVDAIGQLTGGIAHDFNNMLAVIIGGLEIVERRSANGQSIAAFLENISAAAHRAADLTRRLLAFSRQLPLSPEAIDANRLVGTMSELLQRVLGEAMILETVRAPGLWTLHADSGQLENAILNLAINARDAMPEGGTLTIETANCRLDEDYVVSNPDVSPGEYVMIALSDTGTGMSPVVIEKALDPFFTTKDIGKGTGLGLSQVYGFVKQSKGHLKIESETGHGTTVRIYLPRLFGSESHPATTTEIRHPAPKGSLSDVLLVVEDEDRIREITTAGLIELGYTVLDAGSGATALRILKDHPEIDLLFTDIVMPTMNGRQLAIEAQKLRPDLKVLFTTGYSPDAPVQHGIVAQNVSLLPKPFTLMQLAQKLRELLE
ncbi:MAG TPA: PAS domain-containing protein [Stellaceae bacterium]|nr:PAS domain-containing protein [Stellaceae bacterium]